jgi:hypothetical protein
VRYGQAFVDQIRSLAGQHDDSEIVAMLNCDGVTSSTGKPFTINMIKWIRFKHDIARPSRPAGTLRARIRSEHVGHLSMDQKWPLASPEGDRWLAVCRHTYRRDRSPAARLDCRFSRHCLVNPQRNLNEVHYEDSIGVIADNVINIGRAMAKQFVP